MGGISGGRPIEGPLTLFIRSEWAKKVTRWDAKASRQVFSRVLCKRHAPSCNFSSIVLVETGAKEGLSDQLQPMQMKRDAGL
jgi:hypothetical protein